MSASIGSSRLSLLLPNSILPKSPVSLFRHFGGGHDLILALTLVLPLLLSGCASQKMGSRSSVVDYLYPNAEQTAITPATPVLTLPLRLGIAFVPADRSHNNGANPWAFSRQGANLLAESAKHAIMNNIAMHFRQHNYISDIQVIPSSYLRPQGSFANLDQLKSMFGIDVIALVSYDQLQFSDEGKSALSYWTLVGAYLVSGQKNDTSTMMDTAVYDIASRKLLFRAPGISQVKGRATPVNLSEELRRDSQQGFNDASKQMIENLEQELQHFTERLKSQPADIKVVASSNYRGGGMSAWVVLLMLGVGISRRRKTA